VKNDAVSERHFTRGGGDESIILLEGSQASPSRPSDKGTVKVKALEWLQAVT
jgi:hypothetical protein